MFWFFGCEACGILTTWSGIKPAPPALEGEDFTTGPPGKSLGFFFLDLFDIGAECLVTYYHREIVLGEGNGKNVVH